MLPVGPPDSEARASIGRRYTGEITDQDVDLDKLVAASELFTPADIEFAARQAAQRAFEREHFEGLGDRARMPHLSFAAEIPRLVRELLSQCGPLLLTQRSPFTAAMIY